MAGRARALLCLAAVLALAMAGFHADDLAEQLAASSQDARYAVWHDEQTIRVREAGLAMRSEAYDHVGTRVHKRHEEQAGDLLHLAAHTLDIAVLRSDAPAVLSRSAADHPPVAFASEVVVATPHHQHYVHTTGPLSEQQLAVLNATIIQAGGHISEHVPSFTWTVVGPHAAALAASKLDFVDWVGDVAPEHKLSPTLVGASPHPEARAVDAQGLPHDLDHALIVVLPPMPGHRASRHDPSELAKPWERAMRDAGLPVTVTPAGARKLRVDWLEPGRMRSRQGLEMRQRVTQFLADQPQSHWIESQPKFAKFNKWGRWIVQSGERDSAPFDTVSLTGGGQIVHVGDTGVDMQHCFFHDPATKPPFSSIDVTSASTHRKVARYYVDFGDDIDSNGHGTHVAGSIAGSTVDSTPLDDFFGIGHSAKIVVTDLERIAGLNVPQDLVGDYFDPPHAVGARISSNSWGGPDGYSSSSQDVDISMVNHNDLLILFAAGNSGDVGHYSVGSPGNNKNGLAIGASMNDNEGNRVALCTYNGSDECETVTGDEDWQMNNMAFFSSRGPLADGRIKPDLVAPGFFTGSARSDPSAEEPHCSDVDRHGEDEGLLFIAGTSMATPTAAGAMAILREYLVDGFYPTGAANPPDAISSPPGHLMKALALHASRSMTGLWGDHGVHDTTPLSTYPLESLLQGYGRLDLDSTLMLSGVSPHQLWLEYTNSLAIGAQDKHCFTVTAGTGVPVVMTIAWTDPVPSLLSYYKLVNNLDLVVVDPLGRTFQGNSHLGPLYKADNVNPNEQVVITDPVDGTYTAFVMHKYGSGAQGYSIVATAASISSPGSCATVCPNACSGNGACQAPGTCLCNAGFEGPDCSQQVKTIAPGSMKFQQGKPFHLQYFEYAHGATAGNNVVIYMRSLAWGRSDPDLYVSTSGTVQIRSPTTSDIGTGEDHFAVFDAGSAATYSIGVYAASIYNAPYTLEVVVCDQGADECTDRWPFFCTEFPSAIGC